MPEKARSPDLWAKLCDCVQEGEANSSEASDDFFLQEGDPEEAAAMHESQHAPAKHEVSAQIARKAQVSVRGGAVLMTISRYVSRRVSLCLPAAPQHASAHA